jgi:hypothetical protein
LYSAPVRYDDPADRVTVSAATETIMTTMLYEVIGNPAAQRSGGTPDDQTGWMGV